MHKLQVVRRWQGCVRLRGVRRLQVRCCPRRDLGSPVLLYQDLPDKLVWADGLSYDVSMAKPSRVVEAALGRQGKHHFYGRETAGSAEFARNLADGLEPDTMKVARAIRKYPTTRKDLGNNFPAEFRNATAVSTEPMYRLRFHN